MAADKKTEKKKEKKKPTATSVTIKDECLAPYKSLMLFYNGPNPFSVVGKIVSKLDIYFEVSSSGWGEDKFMWDTSGDPIGFYVKWWVRKPLSGYSQLNYDIIVQGDEGAQTKKGRFTVEVTANVVHRVPTGWFHRSMWWIYQYLFYNKRRMEYLKFCRKYSYGFRELLKSEFGLTTTSAREPEMKDFS